MSGYKEIGGVDLPEERYEVYESVTPFLEIASASVGLPVVAGNPASHAYEIQKAGMYDEYIEKFRKGEADTVKSIRGFEDKIKKATETGLRNRYVRVFDGGEVDVAGHLSGRRDCYIRRKKSEQTVSTVFVLSICFPMTWQKNQLENRMASIFGLIEAYRIQRKPIQIYIMLSGRLYGGSATIVTLFEVTNADSASLLQYGSEKFFRLVGWSYFETIFQGRFIDHAFNVESVTLSEEKKKIIKAKIGAVKIILFDNNIDHGDYDTMERAVSATEKIYNREMEKNND